MGYKDYSEQLTDLLSEDLIERVIRMRHPDSGNLVIPYHGGTHGSNAFNTCDTVIFLGYPRLNGQEYLQRALAAYGSEKLLQEADEAGQSAPGGEFTGDPQSLPSVQRYTVHHLAAEVEQAIFRSKHRNGNCNSSVEVYFLYPDEEMLKILMSRFPEAHIIQEKEPDCFLTSKAQSRTYRGGKTSRARLMEWLAHPEQWTASTMSVREIKSLLNISDAVWADLLADPEIDAAITKHKILRTRGRNAAWTRSDLSS